MASSFLSLVFSVILFAGIIASVVGYVGCFSVVQGSGSSKEALIWLILEAGLSVIRIILWGINPKGDDAPPLIFKFELAKDPPLPTCCKAAEEIEELKSLPLVHATEFLEAINSYAGLLHRFNNPTLTLYYTLTRRFPVASDRHLHSEPSSTERVLYITIFDHTERTTRVYTENYQDWRDEEIPGGGDRAVSVVSNVTSDPSYFYSADPIAVDLKHGVLKTRIGGKILRKDDPIAGNPTSYKQLTKHYHSILNQVNSRITNDSKYDTLDNRWSVKLGEVESSMQSLRTKDSVAMNKDQYMERDGEYLKHRSLERKVRGLIPVRGQWIEDYMNWLHKTIDNDLAQLREVHDVQVERYELEQVEISLMKERVEMEMILADEVVGWERELKERLEDVFNSLDSKGVITETSAELAKRWRADLWEQLERGKSMMTARMTAAESRVMDRVMDAGKKGADESYLKCRWESLTINILTSLLSEITSAPSPSSHSSLRHDHLKESLHTYLKEFKGVVVWRYTNMDTTVLRRCRERIQKMKSRLESEVIDVDDRLGRGCHEFRSSPELVHLTHSDCKWLTFDLTHPVLDALNRNNNNQHVIHVKVYDRGDASLDGRLSDESDDRRSDASGNRHSDESDDRVTKFFEAIGNMPSCTSIYLWGLDIPDSITLPPHILSIDYNPMRRLSADQQSTLESNQSHSDETKRTTIEFLGMAVDGDMLRSSMNPTSFTLRFFGPPSSNLTLRLIHHSKAKDQSLIFGSQPFRYPVPLSDSFVLEDIQIVLQDGTQPPGLTFEPDCLNTLMFTLAVDEHSSYFLRDIELLDKHGSPYQPANPAHVEEVGLESDCDEGSIESE